jgi:hypothetical protein
MARVTIEIEVEVDGGPNSRPEDFVFLSLRVGDPCDPIKLEGGAPAPRRLARALALAAGKRLSKKAAMD